MPPPCSPPSLQMSKPNQESSSKCSSERAKGRWKILKNALLQKTSQTKHSIHRFQGFPMLERVPPTLEPLSDPNYEFMAYKLPDSRVIHVRERKSPPTLSEIFSKDDNTGNVRIWNASHVLAWYLHDKKYESVLELGAGMAALPSLAVPASSVTVTDGHVDCVASNRVQFELNQRQARCENLPWTYDDDALVKADAVLIADCVHFEEVHGELLWTALCNCKGCIWMCQPDRGQSWNRFEALVQAAGVVTIEEVVPNRMEELHAMYSTTNSDYDPNIHHPRIFLLTLTQVVDAACKARIQKHFHLRRVKQREPEEAEYCRRS